jgi:peptide deformylase
LHESSERVIQFDIELNQLVTDMYDTLNIARGAGIAAPQINVHKRVIILKCSLFDYLNEDPYDKDPDILVLVNPQLELAGEDIRWDEACLSLPDIMGRVCRKSLVRLKYQNLKGEEKKLAVGWPFSGALQHECDHLDGFLFIDRMGKRAGIELKKELRRKLRLRGVQPSKKIKIKQEKELIDTRLTHGPGKRKKGKRKKSRRKK